MGLDDAQLERYASQQRTAEQAESYSTKYEREFHKRVSSYFERRAIRRALAATGLESGVVLDLPCGAGRLTPLLQPVAAHLVSSDYSGEILKIFQSRYDSPCFEGNAFQLPFADQALDLVFSARLSHHISDPQRRADYLSEIMRVSAGWVVVTIFDRASLKNRLRELRRKFNSKRPKNAFSRAEVAELADAAGFTIQTRFPVSRLASGHLYYVLGRKQPSRATAPEEPLTLYRCPDDRSALSAAEGDALERVNAAIAAGGVVDRAGSAVVEPLDGGLLRADRTVLYPVRGGIPRLIRDVGIDLAQLTAG